MRRSLHAAYGNHHDTTDHNYGPTHDHGAAYDHFDPAHVYDPARDDWTPGLPRVPGVPGRGLHRGAGWGDTDVLHRAVHHHHREHGYRPEAGQLPAAADEIGRAHV